MIKMMFLITLTAFIVAFGLQSFLFYRALDAQNSTLKTQEELISSLQSRVVELEKPKEDQLKEAVQVFYDEFQSAISVYDENVEIYNNHFAKLDKDINDIAQVLLNHMKRTEGM